jgi:hypothetical protein
MQIASALIPIGAARTAPPRDERPTTQCSERLQRWSSPQIRLAVLTALLEVRGGLSSRADKGQRTISARSRAVNRKIDKSTWGQ